MTTLLDDEVNTLLLDFMDNDNYDIKFLRGPVEKDQTHAVETLKSLGFEVFPHVVTTNKNELTIYYRKRRV